MLEDIGFKIEFITTIDEKTDAMVIFLPDDKSITHTHGLSPEILELISNLDKNILPNKFGEIKILTLPSKENKLKYLILVALGKEEELTELSFERLGGKILSQLIAHKIANVSIISNHNSGPFSPALISALLVNGLMLASYKFDKYFTTKKPEDSFVIHKVSFITSDISEAKKMLTAKHAVARGIFLARNCISEPANILYPESYANIIKHELNLTRVKVEVLSKEIMGQLGMGALLGVAQGSINEPKLVVMHYQGAAAGSTPVALVGKGVTFDTGGISLKPRTNMGDMKYDMAGSAAVVGTIRALALRKAKVNVVGVIGLVENMPGGKAQRPGDVVVTMSGKTAEVVDTDSEGRLVLADAVWYAQEKFKPEILIDLATLTGAIGVALGNTYAGIFANDDELSQKLIAAGDISGEKLWRMPLHDDFEEMIKSDIADIANLGNVPGKAGSSTAAHFIKNFIKEDTKWAHLDIANMAWLTKSSDICPKGAVGFGVRLLNQYIQDNYEN